MSRLFIFTTIKKAPPIFTLLYDQCLFSKINCPTLVVGTVLFIENLTSSYSSKSTSNSATAAILPSFTTEDKA